MKNIRIFLSENFHFLVVKFSVYLNRRVFLMVTGISDIFGNISLWVFSRLPQHGGSNEYMYILCKITHVFFICFQTSCLLTILVLKFEQVYFAVCWCLKTYWTSCKQCRLLTRCLVPWHLIWISIVSDLSVLR